MDEALVERMREFGETIFAEMTGLALRTGAVNLGQGFPDEDGPAEVLAAAAAAIAAGEQRLNGSGRVLGYTHPGA